MSEAGVMGWVLAVIFPPRRGGIKGAPTMQPLRGRKKPRVATLTRGALRDPGLCDATASRLTTLPTFAHRYPVPKSRATPHFPHQH
jgi:hypothetical protein